MITIIDSGGANIASIQFCLNRLGVTSRLSTDPSIIKKSSHIILPGVGSAEYAMEKLNQYSLIHVIRSLTQPVLGICVGMQILFNYSEEGNTPCLGLLRGNITKIRLPEKKMIVPHMGWNTINIKSNDELTKNISNLSYVYFVHSYAAPIGEYTTASTEYGNLFSAIIKNNNFYGTQFHPERSSLAGAQILKNFLEL